MYINWAHYTIPKVSFVLSFISNPLFIYLIYTNKKVLFGSYRYLLVFFAIFNLFASVADLLIPVSVFCYRYAFVTFIADGPFSTISQFGEYPLSYRCSFIAGTYGILNIHFVFRYLTLKSNHFLNQYFMPYGLICSVIYVIFHMIIWGLIDFHCLHSAPEIRDYIRVPFKELFNENIDDINFVAGLFWETSPGIIERSWAGILLLTVIASYSMTLYFVLGYKIITGLNIESITMSKQTAQMQKQLFKALAIQTIIPICVSFMPCSLSFYGAALRWDFMNWVYWTSAVAVSMFPFLDPMAIIFFLPALRRRIWDSMGKKRNEVSMVNWAHYTIPKVSFVLSFIFNPVFIYLIYNNKKVLWGSYRYLLAFFAIFNLFASVADLLIPVSVFCFRYAFVCFITDGPFSEIFKYGEVPISYRCAVISGTYGILNVHFVFRYLTLKNNHFLNRYFMPYGLVFSVIYVIFHMIIWGLIDFNCLHSTPEIRDYIRVSFKELYNENIDDINFVAGMFWKASPEIIQRTWVGVLLLTIIASYSMTLYFVLGYKIINCLNTGSISMSKQTAQMQKQLFKALSIQTIIPICVSFMPCTISFYGAALKIDFMNWLYWSSAVAVSMFPFLDPMAIIFFLPALRQRVLSTMDKSRNSVSVLPRNNSNVSNSKV